MIFDKFIGAVFILPLLMLSSCTPVEIIGPLPGKGTEIDQIRAQGGSGCLPVTYCGNIGLLDCGTAYDGTGYYFEKNTGKIIADFGGLRKYSPMEIYDKSYFETDKPLWPCNKN